MDYMRATQIASNVGQSMALIFGLLGILFNPFLVIIALFVWIGAAQEAAMVQTKVTLGGIPVQRAMLTDFHALSAGDPLARAVELVLAGSQQDFPVTEKGQVVGILTKNDLLAAIAKHGDQAAVSDAMRREFDSTAPSEMLETVLTRLQTSGIRTMPVTQQGRLVGLITMENIGEFIAIEAALHGKTVAFAG
jgi:predicted transcriptional regulator